MGSSDLQQVKEKGSSSSSSSSRSLEAEAENNNNIKKCCCVCKITKTPLWRNGPKGPKSLCNACGIQYRKKHHTRTTTTTKNNASFALAENEPRKGKVVKSRNTVRSANNIMMSFTERPGQLGEVERAALLLMAISCGALFA